MIDLSERGACLRDAPPMVAGQAGTLHLDGLDVPLAYTVRSVVDGDQHVAFELDLAVVSKLRALIERVGLRQAA